MNLTELEENEDSTEIPPEILVAKYQAADLANEAAKLKSMEAMDSVPTDRQSFISEYTKASVIPWIRLRIEALIYQ